ncbi:hypothetical protein M0R45_038363 [Rubus argutus]|uniref:DUF8039 domain-containing protein n=1 Tax=Rubus argutus TaxID=59490 RepID=A0AAW1W259_RUBAR
MTAPTWKEFSDTFKNQIWEHVTTSFIVDECHKKQIFRRMTKLWRDNRSILLKEVMKQASVVGLQRVAALLKPDNMESMDEWQGFVKFRTSPEYREMCKKFKAMRADKTLLHKTSRKSFARLEEELKEQSETPDAISRSDVWIHAYEAKKKKGSNEVVEDPEIVKQVKMYKAEQEPSQKYSLKNDAVAKVIGPHPRGRVRGLRFGAVPSKADYQTNVGNKVTKLENALFTQAQDMLSQSQEIQQLKEMVGTLFTRLEKGVNNHGSTSAQQSTNEFAQQKQPENQSVRHCSSDVAQSKQKDARQGFENRRQQSKQSKHNQKEGTRNKGNKDDQNRIELLSWFDMGEEVVATTKLESKDPSVKVHHVPLGHECWKVWVLDVFEDIALYRPTNEFGTLSKSQGSTIAWPIKYIKFN